MKKGKIIIISGPSGSGKTTLHKQLMEDKRFKGRLIESVSATTRARRKGEKDGRDYLFISRKMFLYKKRRGHFLESEKVFENYYGTPFKNVRDILLAGKNVLLCIDVKGAKSVKKSFPKAVTIFIKTPSIAVLADRLKKRGSEGDSVVALRLASAKCELKEEKRYEHVIVNDDFQKAFDRLAEVVNFELKGVS